MPLRRCGGHLTSDRGRHSASTVPQPGHALWPLRTFPVSPGERTRWEHAPGKVGRSMGLCSRLAPRVTPWHYRRRQPIHDFSPRC